MHEGSGNEGAGKRERNQQPGTQEKESALAGSCFFARCACRGFGGKRNKLIWGKWGRCGSVRSEVGRCALNAFSGGRVDLQDWGRFVNVQQKPRFMNCFDELYS